MDTLVHWQWVTWLRLCASVPATTSEELVRRSWGSTGSLRVGWRRCSNTGNDRNILPENKIGNERGCHVRAGWRGGRGVVRDLTERPTGHDRRWRVIARVDVHQRHTGYLARRRRVRWRGYSVHHGWRLHRRLSWRIVRRNHMDRRLIRIVARCRGHRRYRIIRYRVTADVIRISLARRSHRLRVERVIRWEPLLLM